MRILAFAYACEPTKGSEPLAGWVWARMLARQGETWVITRANNQGNIEEELSSLPERENLHFVFVDLPPWSRFWKRGQRGIRLYYLLWQLTALREARRLHARIRFDLVWHLTLANAWLGSVGGLVGPTFVYGPVGGGVTCPRSLLSTLGVRGLLYEASRAFARGLGRFTNPLARIAWRRARLILVQNSETAEWLPARHRGKTTVFPNVTLSQLPQQDGRESEPRKVALFAGRLLAWKGASLAIRACAELSEWTLQICGAGPDAKRLKRIAARLGVTDRVVFLGWRPREEVLRRMIEEADVFLFPSLHDEAGWVVAEALSSGLPIVCLDRGGPPLLTADAGVAVSTRGSPKATAARLADEVRSTIGKANSEGAEERSQELLIDNKTERLRTLLNDALPGRFPLEGTGPALAQPLAPRGGGGMATEGGLRGYSRDS